MTAFAGFLSDVLSSAESTAAGVQQKLPSICEEAIRRVKLPVRVHDTRGDVTQPHSKSTVEASQTKVSLKATKLCFTNHLKAGMN